MEAQHLETAVETPDLNDRQRAILAAVRERGFATIETLAREFDVSMQTVRRDIIHLSDARLLQRFHGGAGAGADRVRLGYAEKSSSAFSEKQRIGAAAAGLLVECASVFLDVGTTVEAVARALARSARRPMRVITTSLPVATALAQCEAIEVFVAGGTLRGLDGSLIGDAAVSAIGRFKVDAAVIGCSGFDSDGSLMDFDLDKIAVKEAAMANASRVLVAADRTKLSRQALVRIKIPQRRATLITSARPPRKLAEAFEKMGLAITLAA